MDYEVLRTEIEGDPAGLGYAQMLATGTDAGIPIALNALGKDRVSLGIVTIEAFGASFAPQIAMIFGDTSSGGLGERFGPLMKMLELFRTIDYGHPFVAGALKSIVGVAGLTQANVDAYTTRPASRGEILFGTGTIVTGQDVAQAMKVSG